MDVQTALLGVAIFVISGVVLLLISVFGIKEKSYEEALAEQRQQTNVLLGTHNKTKPKEKKQKKTGKKVKEKQVAAVGDAETADDSENTDSQTAGLVNSVHPKTHVEFKETTIIEAEKENAQLVNKKRAKKEKVRPILVNKEKPSDIVIDSKPEAPAVNHFEQLHPKDDFELLHTKEENVKHEAAVKEKTKKQSENEPHKNTKKGGKQQAVQHVEPPAQPVEEVTVAKDEALESVTPATQNTVAAVNPGKEKKKKKSEFNTLQQLTGDKQGINVITIMKLVRTAELSRSEVQNLIDLLLNKQHEAPAVVDEWSEGKADPIQKLKKQLAEKEKALTEEQEALVGAQAKLREVRAEQQAERSNQQQRIRLLDETLQVKQVELQATNNRMLSQNQKIQQLQDQLNAELMKIRQIRDEHAALQMQRQQLEMRLAQNQEAEASIVQLRNDIQEIQSRHNVELHSLKEQHENEIAHLHQQLTFFNNEADQKKEIIRNLEENIHDHNTNLSIHLNREAELKMEMKQLQTAFQQKLEEINHLEHQSSQISDEMQKQNEETARINSQLHADLKKVQEENSQLHEANVSGSIERNKAHQVELLNVRNELTSVRSQLKQAEEKYATEVSATIKQLENELDQQKMKNNELRQKNWKVMEALNAAEIRNKTKESANLAEEIGRVRLEEQRANKQFIQRLFPEISVPANTTQDQWFDDVEKAIEHHVTALQDSKNADITKLEAELQHYKTIIDDTEIMLNKLQSHIEGEEITWRNQLRIKEKEIEALKQNEISHLQTQLEELQHKLSVEEEARQKIEEECHRLKSRKPPVQDSFANVEKLVEEINMLREQVSHEQKRNEDLIKSCVTCNRMTQNHNTTNGNVIESEQMLSSTSSAASSLTEVTVKPKNKKKKKKNNQ